MFRPNLKTVASPVPEIASGVMNLWVGLRTPNPGEEKAVGGRGPFERALMSSYKPSIVTFPLSLCCFCAPAHHFTPPHL